MKLIKPRIKPINICEIIKAINISNLDKGARRKSSNEPICLLLIIETDGLSKLSCATIIIINPGTKKSIKVISSIDKE